MISLRFIVRLFGVAVLVLLAVPCAVIVIQACANSHRQSRIEDVVGGANKVVCFYGQSLHGITAPTMLHRFQLALSDLLPSYVALPLDGVYIDDESFDDAKAKRVAHVAHLTHFNVVGTSITIEGVRSLADACDSIDIQCPEGGISAKDQQSVRSLFPQKRIRFSDGGGKAIQESGANRRAEKGTGPHSSSE